MVGHTSEHVHREAAVLRYDGPEAASVARRIPRGAKPRKVGECLLGYDHKPGIGKPRASFSQRAASCLEHFVWWRCGGPSYGDDTEFLDVLLPFWAALARERQEASGWALERARHYLPKLASEWTAEGWRDAEERASERRKGGGWKPDDIAAYWRIREHELAACFGPNNRRRGFLVSVERPQQGRFGPSTNSST